MSDDQREGSASLCFDPELEHVLVDPDAWRAQMVIDARDDVCRATELMTEDEGKFVLRWLSPGRDEVILGACETQEDAQLACKYWIDAQLRCALAFSAPAAVAARYRQRVGDVRIEAPVEVEFSDHDYVQQRVQTLMHEYHGGGTGSGES